MRPSDRICKSAGFQRRELLLLSLAWQLVKKRLSSGSSKASKGVLVVSGSDSKGLDDDRKAVTLSHLNHFVSLSNNESSA